MFHKDAVYSFRYQAGTNPGSHRLVVCTVDATHGNLQGFDVDKSAIRNFKPTQMRDLKSVSDVLICRGENLPPSVSLKYIAQQYENDGYTTWIDEDDEKVIAAKEPRLTFETHVGSAGAILTLSHKGSILKLEVPTHRQGVCLRRFAGNGGSKQQIADATAEEIALAITEMIK